MSNTKCPVCGGQTRNAFKVLIHNSFESQLATCNACEFSFYPDQNWLSGSFSEELNSLDVGSVDRVLLTSEFLTEFIFSEKLASKKFLDYGGGYGLQTRILRDRGFDWENFDPYTAPLFSRDFVGNIQTEYSLISLIEVSLHFENPIEEFQKLLSRCDYLVFTSVVPEKEFGPDWWYVTGESGQHVAFYSIKTLRQIATHLNVEFTSDGKFFHVFHKKKLRLRTKILLRLRPLLFGAAAVRNVSRFVRRGLGISKSLLEQDQKVAKAKLIK